VPVYEYRCRNGHQFEVTQKMADDPVERCPECKSPVERLFRPVAVHFKGSGFYTTDYGRKKTAAGAGSPSEDSKGSSDSKGGKEKSGSEQAAASSKSKSSDE
jgi:putative FmdB family regulatory protein